LRFLNTVSALDVVILGRGGGSSEDLAAFNEEIVAQAIFTARMPVVSAVGHEIDVTIADLVADRRALTPSEAAELVTPDREQLLKALQVSGNRLADLLWRKVQGLAEWLNDLGHRRVLAQPLERIRNLERRLDESQERLQRAMRQRLAKTRQDTAAWAGRLESLSPLNVLARGYSLTRREGDEQVIRSAGQVRPGDRLVTLLGQGRITSRVEDVGVEPGPRKP
jgi:exodeoxyribonuclease VII large subunit